MASKKQYRSIADLPGRLSIFPLAGALLLPHTQLPLNIFEPRYLAMFDAAISGHRLIGMIQPLDSEGADAGTPKIYGTGCAGRITSFAELVDGRMLVTLTGIARFTVIRELELELPYRQVEADYSQFEGDLVQGAGEETVDRELLLKTFRAYLDAHDLKTDWSDVLSASSETLVNSLSTLAPYPIAEKQALLEAPDLRSRAELLVALTEIDLSRKTSGSNPRLQ
jgi:Lon protease-like protein